MSNSNYEDELEEEEPPESEYSSIREYLAQNGEEPSAVRDVNEILMDPSNIASDGDSISLVAWDVREQGPRGSYLYILQQDLETRISQVHRYFCLERRLDVLTEICEPIASVYSDSGVPFSVRYSVEGVPAAQEAEDLDPALFSRGTGYIEANEYLLDLQEYFDSMRV